MSTVTTLEPVEHLDFDPELPCGNEPCPATASFRVAIYCGCVNLFCGACVAGLIELVRMHLPGGWRCVEDGNRKYIEKISDFIVSVHPL